MNTFITCGSASLTLTADQCAQIARGLEIAAANNDHEAGILDLLANLFATAAIAATQQYHLPPSKNADLAADLADLGLGGVK